MTVANRPRAVLTAIVRTEDKPWWWQHLDHEALPCQFEFGPVVLPRGRPRSLFSHAFVSMCWQTLRLLLRARRDRQEYLFTFECDWPSFLIAGLQTVLGLRRPRHVILQFIMRERTESTLSRMKYAVMRWCFSSVYLCICSARPECDYYARAFGWPRRKLDYVPLHTDPDFLARPRVDEEQFVLSAGRTFRDYPTLLSAFDGSSTPLTIVTSPSSLRGASVPSNVTLTYDIPIAQLVDLIARSMMVVVPLEDRKISIGQSVVLEAMTMGKAVIATRVNGTVDYIDHMRTGILVPPGDAGALRDAVHLLATDSDLRHRLGRAALEAIRQKHLPVHYADGVAQVLASAGRA
jgi:glycosyltransferase involved in cell wall biosynthesis